MKKWFKIFFQLGYMQKRIEVLEIELQALKDRLKEPPVIGNRTKPRISQMNNGNG